MIKPRIIKIKAWNVEDRLLKRISKVDCVKSELHKEGHILLQYTGMEDQNDVEIYDGDLLLHKHQKYVVSWDENKYQWIWTKMEDHTSAKFEMIQAKDSLRLCHSLESSEDELNA